MSQKDSRNMVPQWSIQQIMEDERSVEASLKKRQEFRDCEPEAAEWVDLLIQSDLDKVSNSFPEIYSASPKLQKTIYFMLWKAVLRGWLMGEAKWKSNLLPLPGESVERNPNHYIPKSEDFF